jgi:diadenosine tetraphosphate (Ap4A) HIT family hydrolase
MFSLHPQLAADTALVGHLALCRLVLMNDRTFPWLILVPEREAIREIFELSDDDQLRLIREISLVSRAVADCCHADKINVAALGNVVPQLHVHIISRFENGPAWPGPVWGKLPATPYPMEDMQATLHRLRSALATTLR